MTDKEKLLELFESFGITPDIEEDRYPSRVNAARFRAETGGVRGYYGFYVQFEFNDAGEFLEFGVWE